MTHRIAYLKPGRHIYTKTGKEAVSLERTIAEIKTMLLQNGCTRIATQDDMRGKVPLHTVMFEKEGLPYMIEFPVLYERHQHGPDKLIMEVSGRIIRDRIKALLIEVEIGMSPFTAAMVQFLAIQDRSTGKPTQMENFVLEHPADVPRGTLFLPAGGP